MKVYQVILPSTDPSYIVLTDREQIIDHVKAEIESHDFQYDFETLAIKIKEVEMTEEELKNLPEWNG